MSTSLPKFVLPPTLIPSVSVTETASQPMGCSKLHAAFGGTAEGVEPGSAESPYPPAAWAAAEPMRSSEFVPPSTRTNAAPEKTPKFKALPAIPDPGASPARRDAPKLRVLRGALDAEPLPVSEGTEVSDRSLFDEAGRLERDHFDFYHRSFSSTLVSSVMMMSGVQCVRALSGGEFFTPSFAITLPLDVSLTLTSHAIALNHIPFLKKVFDGEIFGSRYEAATRIGANILMGVGYTYASWGMAGINFTLEKCLLALGLCTVVYPTIYFIKSKVFKQIPLKRDLKRLEKLRGNRLFGEEFQKLESEILRQAGEKNIPEEERDYLVISTLENLVMQHPYEDTIRNLPSLSARKEFQDAVKKADGARLHSQKVKARVRLIELLLKVASKRGAAAREARRALHLGEPFTHKGSIALMKAMVRRYRDHRKWVWIGSLIDQFVSVGIAGGIGLYSVNEYALGHD